MQKSIIKIISMALIVGLNWAGLSAVLETFAYYQDTENSSGNSFSATILNFSLNSPGDFSPETIPDQTSTRDINVFNDGILDFQYIVHTINTSGVLCGELNLSADLDGTNIYNGPLTNFNYNAGEFSSTTDDWEFTASLTSDDPTLQNQTCNFDFVFDGSQISGAGFSDQEIISNTIISGQWIISPPPPTPLPDLYLKINEVYYDPDSQHGDANDEWIEFYNACGYTVNLKNWYLMDNNATETINSSYDVGTGQFVVIAANASTWEQYWQLIPKNAVKIALGGQKMFNGLNNDGDRIFLYNNEGVEIDAVSWGTDNSAFEPPVSDAEKGHSIARKIKGVDTDTADDWEDLTEPNPGTNPHSITGEETISNNPPIEPFISEEEIAIEEEPKEPIIEEEAPAELLAETMEVEEQPVEEPAVEEEVIEELPALEEQPVIVPDNTNSDQNPTPESDGGEETIEAPII